MRHSKGIPRNINNLCFQALSLGFAKNKKEIDEAIIREVIADLSLEPLQTSVHVAANNAQEQHFGDTRARKASIGMGSTAPRARKASVPTAHVRASSLDEVSLGSDPMFEVDETDFGAEWPGSRLNVSHEQRPRVRPLFIFGLAAALVCLWAGPRVKSGIQFLERVAGYAPKSEALASPTVPPVANTNSLGTNLGSAETPSIPNNGPIQPGANEDNLNSLAPEGSSAARAGENPVVPAIVTSPAPVPKRDIPRAREVLYTTGGIPTGSGRLIVESSESGAQVTINGKSNPKWVTPHIFYVASGTYVVSVSKSERKTWTDRVHVGEGQEKMLVARLEDDGTGFFIVDTHPAGMQVFIDGRAFGPSRVETVLQAGWHTCEVIPGPGLQPLVRKFHLAPGESITRRIRMNSPEASLRAPRVMPKD